MRIKNVTCTLINNQCCFYTQSYKQFGKANINTNIIRKVNLILRFYQLINITYY